MGITSARLVPYRLPFAQPWRSTQGDLKIREGWLVRLAVENGQQGVGDAAPLPAAGTETPERALAWLGSCLDRMRGLEPQEALERLDEDAPPAARCGVETALLDILSQRRGTRLARWLDGEAVDSIEVNAALGPLGQKTPDAIRAASAEGYRVMKLKVGIAPWREELASLRQIAPRLPAGIHLRLDANRAWAPTEASAFLAGLDGIPVEALEEPLADYDPALLRQMQRDHPFAIAIDESLPELDPEHLFQAPPCRRLVLKPTREGGLRRTVELARKAHATGMEVVVTTLLESAVGCHAAAHVALAVDAPNHPLAHGLDTGRWLRQDVAMPLQPAGGRLSLPPVTGLGVSLEEEYDA